MSTTTVLIIDDFGDCSLCAAKVLMPEGLGILAAGTWEKGRQLLAQNRPDLVVADCRVTADPLVWVEEAHRLNLPAQVIAVADEPDFDRSMDWVAGGVFNVLTRPLDPIRLQRLALAALENRETFKMIVGPEEIVLDQPLDEASSEFAEFYQGLAGRLDLLDLKNYLMTGVKNLTGARRVELCLVDGLTDASYCLETHTFIGHPSRSDPGRDLPPAPVSGQSTGKCRLGFELSAHGKPLGEMYLYFENRNDLKVRDRETMMEVVSTVSAALGSVARYKKAMDLASRDSLTGLYNRRIFNEVLQREFQQAQRHKYPLSLLSLDLDHFKSVNDNFGHQTGDLVLRAVAEVIAKVARSTDLPARVGGEEFAIILPHTSQIQAGYLADRLRHILAESDFNLSGTVFRQTVSQGVAGLEHFLVKTPEDMIYWADQALYLAKREGRDTIRLATDLPMTPVLKKDGPYAFQ